MSQAALSFACLAGPGRLTRQASVLAASIREFGGESSPSPIWGLLEQGDPDLDDVEHTRFETLGIRVLRYRLPQEMASFPLARKVAAAAAIEQHARGKTEGLVWMDAHSLVVRHPHQTLLENSFRIGCRPVDHLLIGSRFDEPLDPFWQYIYRRCGVPEGRMFPMSTSVDRVKIRPYINAGFLAVKPETGLLARWFDVFVSIFNESQARSFYAKNDLWRIFMHQAVLTGVVLRCLHPTEIKMLPDEVNVPLHLFKDLDQEARDGLLDRMVTCRYDVRFEDPQWLGRLPLKDKLKAWLERQWE